MTRAGWHTYAPGQCPCDFYEYYQGGGVYACHDFYHEGGGSVLVRAPNCPQPVTEPATEPIIQVPVIQPVIQEEDKKGIDPKLIIIAVIAFILLSRS